MNDEIRGDEDAQFEKELGKTSSGEGKLSACPNLTHLSEDEKAKIVENVTRHCGETMMKTYISLGIGGASTLVLEDGITKTKYQMDFKVFRE